MYDMKPCRGSIPSTTQQTLQPYRNHLQRFDSLARCGTKSDCRKTVALLRIKGLAKRSFATPLIFTIHPNPPLSSLAPFRCYGSAKQPSLFCSRLNRNVDKEDLLCLTALAFAVGKMGRDGAYNKSIPLGIVHHSTAQVGYLLGMCRRLRLITSNYQMITRSSTGIYIASSSVIPKAS